MVHQLLVVPLPPFVLTGAAAAASRSTEPSTKLPTWLDWRADFVVNREEVWRRSGLLAIHQPCQTAAALTLTLTLT